VGQDFLIVDGYNVIHAWPELEKLKAAGLDHARGRLVSILANYAHLAGCRVWVVFDAHQVKNAAERQECVDGVEVVFTREGETADSFIERLAGELSAAGGTVYVVTSDWAEQRLVFGRGAYRLTPSELKKLVEKAKEESKKFFLGVRPADAYLENRLAGKVKAFFEKLRRERF